MVPGAWQASFQAVNQGVMLLVPFVFYFALAGWSEFLGVALRARGRRGQEAALILCLRVCNLAAVAVALWRGGGLWPAWRGRTSLSTVPPVVLGALLARRARREAAVARARIPSATSCACRGRWPSTGGWRC